MGTRPLQVTCLGEPSVAEPAFRILREPLLSPELAPRCGRSDGSPRVHPRPPFRLVATAELRLGPRHRRGASSRASLALGAANPWVKRTIDWQPRLGGRPTPALPLQEPGDLPQAAATHRVCHPEDRISYRGSGPSMSQASSPRARWFERPRPENVSGLARRVPSTKTIHCRWQGSIRPRPVHHKRRQHDDDDRRH